MKQGTALETQEWGFANCGKPAIKELPRMCGNRSIAIAGCVGESAMAESSGRQFVDRSCRHERGEAASGCDAADESVLTD